MDITPTLTATSQRITRYGNGGFVVNDVAHSGGVLLLPATTQAWNISAPEQITIAALQPVLEIIPKVEILLIGMGKGFQPLAQEIRQHFRAHGVSVDAMDTGAACRTHNVLMSEGRIVASALIAVE